MNRRQIIVASAPLLFVAIVGLTLAIGIMGTGPTKVDSRGGPYRGSEPPGDNRLPDFALPSYRGGVVRSQGLRGRVVLTTFVDTACTDACPVIVGVVGRALRELSVGERQGLVALAFTVNPPSDSASHVRRFLRQRGALGYLDYLVAPTATMRPVWRSFHVLPATETGDADVHSADVRIFDQRGRWVSNLTPGADLTVANLLHDIREALRAS